MAKRVVIGVLRREVSEEERYAFETLYPGRDLVFQRLDSQDYVEHLALCLALQPNVVLLPLDRPIPSTAMEAGFRHVAFFPQEGLKELLPLRPEFKRFDPT